MWFSIVCESCGQCEGQDVHQYDMMHFNPIYPSTLLQALENDPFTDDTC